jgi:hypothetical protein
MSIRTRIDDARFLFANGQKEGALLSILVAVAATSRKRYPRAPKGKKGPKGPTETDRGAFETFVKSAIHRTWGVQNYNVNFRGKMTPLESVLYEFVRCELAHEGTMPSDVVISPSAPGDMMLVVDVKPHRLTLSESFLDGLINTVVAAPENSSLFAASATVASAARSATPSNGNFQS